MLLHLPIYSYLVLAAAGLLIAIVMVREWVSQRTRRRELENERRARVATGILRVLTDERVRRKVGAADD